MWAAFKMVITFAGLGIPAGLVLIPWTFLTKKIQPMYRVGKWIAAAGIRAAIAAGIDTIEHCSLASDEAIKLAIAHNTWFDMDIYNDDYILATGTANGTEQESLDKERRSASHSARPFSARSRRACT